MISLKELNPNNYPTSDEVKSNLNKLLEIMNKIRVLYNKAMIVTSGLRSQADQDKINPSAPKSKHLLGAACDIADNDSKLWEWCKDNKEALKALGVYLEDMDYIREKYPDKPKWVHFQIIAPKSGKFIFIP